MRHCKAGWVEFVAGRAEVPQTCVWMLSVVSQWNIALCSSTGTPQLHMPPYQGPPCSIQTALGVPTQLSQMHFIEELSEEGGM